MRTPEGQTPRHGTNWRAYLLHHHEHACAVAGEGRETDAFVPFLPTFKGLPSIIHDDIENDRVTAGDVGDVGCLFEDVVHEDSAKSSALSRLVHCDLSQEEYRDLAVLRRPSRPTLELGHIHLSQVDRVVPKDPCTTIFYDDMDSRHVVPLLSPGAKLEVVVQSIDATVETGAVMPRRIELFDSDDRWISRHVPRARDSCGPPREREGSGLEERRGPQRTARHPPG